MSSPQRVADRADRPAHQIVGIERLGAVVAAPVGRRVGKQREARECRARPLPSPARRSRRPTSATRRAASAIGSSTPLPSVTNSGQIRSAGVSTVSRCSARLQAVARVRRRRSGGIGRRGSSARAPAAKRAGLQSRWRASAISRLSAAFEPVDLAHRRCRRRGSGASARQRGARRDSLAAARACAEGGEFAARQAGRG